MSERPRRFFLPLIGFTLLFAAFGPAIGGVLFAPIVVVLAAQHGAEAAGTAAGRSCDRRAPSCRRTCPRCTPRRAGKASPRAAPGSGT